MSFRILILIVSIMISKNMIFKFNTNSDISDWKIVDDVVMGGRSFGNFKINENGFGEFYGDVSLENNGGFSSVRYSFKKYETTNFKKFKLKIKGDGKKYQFRVKTNRYDSHSYTYTIQTDSTWQTIEVLFSEMIPVFRGRELNMKNYQGNKIEEIAFLIGNKKNESFKFEIDSIELN